MLTSILSPMGHGDTTSRRRWLELAALHSLGSTLAAGAIGGAMACVAWLIGRSDPFIPVWMVGTLVALVYLPRELGLTEWPPLIQSTRQVPQRWAFAYPRQATAVLYGLGLGAGLYTRIVVPSFYLLLIWPLVLKGTFWGVIVWACYGLVRSLHLWWLTLRAPLGDLQPYTNRFIMRLIPHITRMRRANAFILILATFGLIVWRHQT